jgi:sterol-4alpha-carboxylate 3-dehydrogenase (decarboxylating)
VECAAGIREVKAFVYTSSASVVHDTVSDLVNADERWPCVRGKLQKEYYSETKVRWYRCIFIMNVQTCLTVGFLGRCREDSLEANRKSGQMLTVSIRPAGIVGEGDVQAIPACSKHMKRGKRDSSLAKTKISSILPTSVTLRMHTF